MLKMYNLLSFIYPATSAIENRRKLQKINKIYYVYMFVIMTDNSVWDSKLFVWILNRVDS